MGTVQHVDDGLLHSSGRNLSFLLSILGLVAQRGTPLGMDPRAPRDSFPSMECSDARTSSTRLPGRTLRNCFFCFATPPVAWQWRLESRLRRKHSVCLFRSRSRFVVGYPFLIAQFLWLNACFFFFVRRLSGATFSSSRTRWMCRWERPQVRSSPSSLASSRCRRVHSFPLPPNLYIPAIQRGILRYLEAARSRPHRESQ